MILYFILSLSTFIGLNITPTISFNLLETYFNSSNRSRYRVFSMIVASLLFPYTFYKLYQIGMFKQLVLPIVISSLVVYNLQNISLQPVYDKYNQIISNNKTELLEQGYDNKVKNLNTEVEVLLEKHGLDYSFNLKNVEHISNILLKNGKYDDISVSLKGEEEKKKLFYDELKTETEDNILDIQEMEVRMKN